MERLTKFIESTRARISYLEHEVADLEDLRGYGIDGLREDHLRELGIRRAILTDLERKAA